MKDVPKVFEYLKSTNVGESQSQNPEDLIDENGE
jgi:hypothetical protein